MDIILYVHIDSLSKKCRHYIICTNSTSQLTTYSFFFFFFFFLQTDYLLTTGPGKYFLVNKLQQDLVALAVADWQDFFFFFHFRTWKLKVDMRCGNKSLGKPWWHISYVQLYCNCIYTIIIASEFNPIVIVFTPMFNYTF